MSRKLASIRIVSEIISIDGADNIELVQIDGWQCITKKGEFKSGDPCIYFEIDSFLPILPEFEFLRASSYKKMGEIEGFRIKTRRLRGVLSQGLALPVPVLLDKSLWDRNVREWKEEEGTDVTEILGVIKYDPTIPVKLLGTVKGNFPSFIKKTDQERVQNIWNKIKDCRDTFEVTIKLDGMSCTYYLKDGQFGVCSRNLEILENEDNTLWKLARRYKIEECLRQNGKNIALQGEVVGEGIQGNPNKLIGQDFFLFDIWDIDNQAYVLPEARHNWLLWEDASDLMTQAGMRHVYITDHECGIECFGSLEELLKYPEVYQMGGMIEGLVFKSNESDLTFKVISNAYLLREKG